MLIATSLPARTASGTGSLATSCPGATRTWFWPAKLTRRLVAALSVAPRERDTHIRESRGTIGVSQSSVSGDFSPVLAKHSKHFSLEDTLSVRADRMQWNSEPMRQQVESWGPTAPSRGGKADDLPGVHRRRLGRSEALGWNPGSYSSFSQRGGLASERNPGRRTRKQFRGHSSRPKEGAFRSFQRLIP